MTPNPQPHPQRCETCRNTKGAKIGDCEYYRICLKTNKRIWGYQAEFTSLVDCVSHSDSDKSSAAVLDELADSMNKRISILRESPGKLESAALECEYWVMRIREKQVELREQIKEREQ